MAEPACAVRHERLERVEALASETAQAVHGHGLRLEHIVARVDGLAHAHDATLEAVRASTAAVDRLGLAIERFDSRMDQLVDDYAAHKRSDASDRYALPRVALWLWATSIAALGSLIALGIAEWRAVVGFVRGLPWQ